MGQSIKWFAAKTRANQEFAIQRKISELQIEAFVPTIKLIRARDGKKKSILKAALPNIVFIRASKESAYKIINEYGLKITYMIDAMTKKALIIPDRQMEDFKRVMLEFDSERVTFSTITKFTPGDPVRITSGPFANVKGILGHENTDRQVSIHLNGVATIFIQLNKDTLEKTDTIL